MSTPEMDKRNQEIGILLHRVRSGKRVPAATCAQLLRTSRRRYSSIERGEAPITLAEYEMLVHFLEIDSDQAWPSAPIASGPNKVVVHVPLGKEVQVFFSSDGADSVQLNNSVENMQRE
jgi:transcriptional regulator with XRE-family HTH domain